MIALIVWAWLQPPACLGKALGMSSLFKISSAWVNLCLRRGGSSQEADGEGEDTKFHSWVNSPLPFSW